MALRFYPLHSGSTSGLSVGITTYRGTWSTGGTPALFASSLDKADEGTNGYEAVSCGVGSPGPIDDTDSGNTFIYLLPANTRLSGTIQVCLPVAGDNRYVENIVAHAYVSTGTTGGLRGTLLNNYIESAGTNEMPDSVTAVSFASAQSITTVDALAGDYIVVEIGFAFRGPAPNNGSLSAYHGCKSSGGVVVADLVAGDLVNIGTASGAAWVEFAVVPTPIPVDVSTADCCTTAPGASSGIDTDATNWVASCAGGGTVPTAATPATAETWNV
jgi:hypothetical protein